MTYKTLISGTAITLSLGFAAMPAMAQDASQAPTALAEWNYDEIYSNGWSAEEFMDEVDVTGADGAEIGDIENVLIGEDGRILSLIVEVGGFLDIGDSHISVPWEEVTIAGEGDDITVPINEDNMERYSLFGESGYFTMPEGMIAEQVNDDLLTGPRVWKASELIGDYALLNDGDAAYGYVDDLIFDDQGMIMAVIVDPAVGTGRYAYPYYGYGYGFHPGYTFYMLPYAGDEVEIVTPFDETQMESWDD
ncbi:PRC-barrel domain-containing protein [Inquilinus sp. CAU 1745]|uniref:PRC-barrel domain-containing protein n=1 Tax=Inquilinus sp. CAU 1745 TaxID=3140369 RepID=UPI00325BAAE1